MNFSLNKLPLLLLLTVFIVGCKKEVSIEEPVIEEAIEEIPSKIVAASEPSTLFFLKQLVTNTDRLEVKAEILRAGETADIILTHSTDQTSWDSEGSVHHLSEVTDLNKFAYFLDPNALARLAESVADSVVTFKLADKKRVNKKLRVLKNRIAKLNSHHPDDFESFVFVDQAFQDFVSTSKMPGSFLQLGDDVAASFESFQANQPLPKYALWTSPPAPDVASVFTSNDIKNIVLELELGSGDDLIGIVEQNLSTLSQILEPYSQNVMPFLQQYCIECHDADTAEGEVVFDLYPSIAEAKMHPKLWEEALELIEMGDMPPRKKQQPSAAEKAVFESWVEDLGHQWDSGAMGEDPGQITLRRLNRNEYNYTIRDLFGINIRPADNFPEDAGGESGFNNNSDALFLPPLLMENYVESAGLIVEAVYKDRKALQRYLYTRPRNNAETEKVARSVIKFWASRAFRKPVGKEELERLVGSFNNNMEKHRDYTKAMQMPLVYILISPNFLFRAESVHPDKDLYKISDFDLANRLSYFLWSSMPDMELFRLAQKRELSKPEVLEQQVIRMLKDPKSMTLAKHFGGQWFKWEDLRNRVNPDTGKFPMFTFDLRVSMYRESTMFFDNLVKSNGSALDLIDSDYTFVDSRLSQLYGLNPMKGDQLRKVQLTDRNRGGVLGMASVLTATSSSSRTSPAIRGDWILTELLGTPPPDPPMNVDQLPEDDRELGATTMREALVEHRDNPNCKSCHQVIDPLGFGLENFDPIGRWRTTNNGQPIDSKGTLVDGRTFDSPAELKAILLEDKEKFARTMSEKALTYALGRELTPYDRSTITDIAEKVVADDYRMHRVFLEVAKSYPFTHRKKNSYKPKPKLN